MKGSSKKLSGQSAKPAKFGHKKVGMRKFGSKSGAKHTVRASRADAAMRGSEQYLSYSGKFTVRLPKSLHQALVDRAEKEGVSLNLFVTNALSRTVATPGKSKR
jgi:predicted HicB family RNase H-like nuclease